MGRSSSGIDNTSIEQRSSKVSETPRMNLVFMYLKETGLLEHKHLGKA